MEYCQMTKKKLTLDDCVHICLSDGKWHTFWDIQEKTQQINAYFGETSISASIRNMRKRRCRTKYNLSKYGEVIEKRRRKHGKGWEYRLVNPEKEIMQTVIKQKQRNMGFVFD